MEGDLPRARDAKQRIQVYTGGRNCLKVQKHVVLIKEVKHIQVEDERVSSVVTELISVTDTQIGLGESLGPTEIAVTIQELTGDTKQAKSS